MSKLFKVRVGRPGTRHIFCVDPRRKIKSEYFVVAKSFNEAGKLVTQRIDKAVAEQKSSVLITEDGFEDIDDVCVFDIELLTDELVC